MKNVNAKAWSTKKLESNYSLDAQYSRKLGNGKFTFSDCVSKKDFDESRIDVQLFINGLTTQERSIVLLLFKGFSKTNIANILVNPRSQINKIIECIKEKHSNYFDNRIDL